PKVPSLLSLSQELNIEDKTEFSKWMPRKLLFQKMAESHVFLYPSLREGGGAVVVEAMACGLPVICLDLAGPGFHIQKDWGIKIEAIDPDYVIQEMVSSLDSLHGDENTRHKLGTAAQKRADEYYVWDRQGERLLELYKDSLSI
ncbi:glycosyltransferase, partial [Acidobacteriota bacterium]